MIITALEVEKGMKDKKCGVEQVLLSLSLSLSVLQRRFLSVNLLFTQSLNAPPNI